MQFDPHILRQCWFLAGPTASGKSAVSLELAERLNAEIVSLDSMTLYRGMDIGTAKASGEDRARVPHHLLDIIDPHAEFTLEAYLQEAERVCRSILERGRVPLFVGGTGLYLRGVLRGVFAGPEADWELRHRLEAEVVSAGQGALHARLAAVDPVTAARLHANDTRRVIRALEVYELTGVPLSAQQQEKPLPPGERPAHVYWLSPPREWLYARIDRRVEQMLAGGLVAEVETLWKRSPPLSRTAGQALGYKEVIDHLEGRVSLAEAATFIQNRTRQFAKRQHTWFRNLEECMPIEITGAENPVEIAETIAACRGTVV